MNCPSCNSPLESNARFCGVCGFRLQAPKAAPTAEPSAPVAQKASPAIAAATAGLKPKPQISSSPPKPKAKVKQGDEIYIDTVLNNRFKVEAKIGEGGFGAVYKGTQLATGRKVALKLLHPEMTKDENLVARFRREGMVLCNLRDAHTITTYDFDQTPDGTLYIAMELLEGKSLHHIFHEEAPLEWKRVFKILTEMCSSLAEAHSQGIVHRDLKPENIYLETRPGNPEFVKILDFGIAKVMRGDSIDPQSPQLTATGQTLGTLEYMSPEQLMGKQLDGRSDVYALGVVAYEMITGKLPFPDAKGPAGLITAQLKTVPPPPSSVIPKANLSQAVDRVILKCLEKDKNNRHADVTALSSALQEVVSGTSQVDIPVVPASLPSQPRIGGAELLETRRGDMPMIAPPAMPQGQVSHGGSGPINQHQASSPFGVQSSPNLSPFAVQSSPNLSPFAGQSSPSIQPMNAGMSNAGMSNAGMQQNYGQPYQQQQQPMMNNGPGHGAPYPQASVSQMQTHRPVSSKKWIWWVVGLLALGAAAGAVLALVMRH
ncbi:MAG TPA: serine/threonine-protein kinase [Kofleriaceae bacterium]|jgi:serine/threonine-protein kinase